jgi:hypothetical protein
MDNFCLAFDPQSPTCVKEFGFFGLETYNLDVSRGLYTFLGLAPVNPINGPSFVKTLYETENMLNFSASW